MIPQIARSLIKGVLSLFALNDEIQQAISVMDNFVNSYAPPIPAPEPEPTPMPEPYPSPEPEPTPIPEP